MIVIRSLKMGLTGPDVLAVQGALNKRNGARIQTLTEDGVFGSRTQRAVIAFQQERRLTTDGIVGPITRSALFPLVAATTHVLGKRSEGALAKGSRTKVAFASPVTVSRSIGGSSITPVSANMTSFPFRVGVPFFTPQFLLDLVRLKGLPDMIAVPRSALGQALASQEFSLGLMEQTSLEGWLRKPSRSFGLSLSTTFIRKKLGKGAIEGAQTFQLGVPRIGQLTDRSGVTLQWSTDLMWVDPLWQKGLFHFSPAYASAGFQHDLKGETTVNISLFPVNVSVDLDGDSLSLSANSGVQGSLDLESGVVKWTPQLGVGVSGKFSFF
jgi:hypothetical protein